MFAMEFLVRGARDFNEPGVLMTFEETSEEMTRNVESLGFDLKSLVDKQEIVSGLCAHRAQRNSGNRRVRPGRIVYPAATRGRFRWRQTRGAGYAGSGVLGFFESAGMLRAEIRRLFRWLKDRKLTTVVTAERGDGTLTRYGLEEYVSDCVVAWIIA